MYRPKHQSSLAAPYTCGLPIILFHSFLVKSTFVLIPQQCHSKPVRLTSWVGKIRSDSLNQCQLTDWSADFTCYLDMNLDEELRLERKNFLRPGQWVSCSRHIVCFFHRCINQLIPLQILEMGFFSLQTIAIAGFLIKSGSFSSLIVLHLLQYSSSGYDVKTRWWTELLSMSVG